MASDMSDSSIERVYLDYALGKRRVRLAGLYAGEFDELLSEKLAEVNLRELRGFKPLRQFLSKSPNSIKFGERQNPLENVEVTSDTIIDDTGCEGAPITLDTHVISAARGGLSYVVTYRRHDTGEETTDWKVVDHQWGRNRSLPARLDQEWLVLRRPNDQSKAVSNLYIVHSTAAKVLHLDRMHVIRVAATTVCVESFRELFGSRYADIARDLIWGIADIYRATFDDLKSKAELFNQKALEMERFSRSIKG